MWEEILGKILQRIKEIDVYCCFGVSDWGIKKKKKLDRKQVVQR